MVIEFRTLLPTPVVQTVVDLQDPFTPPQALPSHLQDQGRQDLGPNNLDPYPLSHVVTLDMLQVSLSIIGAHMDDGG